MPADPVAPLPLDDDHTLYQHLSPALHGIHTLLTLVARECPDPHQGTALRYLARRLSEAHRSVETWYLHKGGL